MFRVEVKTKQQIERERSDRQREAMQNAIQRQTDMVDYVAMMAGIEIEQEEEHAQQEV